MTEKQSLVEQIYNMRRPIWFLLIILIAVPLIVPFPTLAGVTSETRAVYNTIENIPDGSVVIFDIGVDVAMWEEMEPASVAVIQHIMRKSLKLIFISFYPDGPLLAERALAAVDLGNKELGVDYVNLGYLLGGETAVAAFADNIRSVVESDINGKPLSELPIMDGVNSANDFIAYLYVIQADPSYQVRQVNVPFGVPIIGLPTAFARGYVMPYYLAGQIIGTVTGLRGGAEYEALVGIYRWGSQSATITSIVYYAVVFMVIFGNVLHLYLTIHSMEIYKVISFRRKHIPCFSHGAYIQHGTKLIETKHCNTYH
jgi:hypothetical protein